MKRFSCAARFAGEDASALTAVTVLVLLVTLAVGIVMAAEVLHRRHVQRAEERLGARYVAEEALARVQAALEGSAGLGDLGELWRLGEDTARVHLLPFGGYWRAVVEGRRGHAAHRITALLLDEAPEAFDWALVLGDSSGGLTLVDTARIEGRVAIGSTGLQRGGAGGFPFRGRAPDTVVSSPERRLPAFDQAQLEGMLALSLAGAPVQATARTLPGLLASSPPSAEGRRFVLPPGTHLRGPLRFSPFDVVQTSGALRIEGDVRFDHTLVVARDSLVVLPGARGPVQLVCDGTVRLRGPLDLAYPSLVLSRPFSVEEGAQAARYRSVDVQGPLRLDGALMALSSTAPAQELQYLRLGREMHLRGAVYTGGYAEVHGRIDGTLMAFSTRFYRTPTLYLGWMSGGDLSARRRPRPFGLPGGFRERPRTVVAMRWDSLATR